MDFLFFPTENTEDLNPYQEACILSQRKLKKPDMINQFIEICCLANQFRRILYLSRLNKKLHNHS